MFMKLTPGVDLFLGMIICMSTKCGAELFLGISPLCPLTGVAWNLPVEPATCRQGYISIIFVIDASDKPKVTVFTIHNAIFC